LCLRRNQAAICVRLAHVNDGLRIAVRIPTEPAVTVLRLRSNRRHGAVAGAITVSHGDCEIRQRHCARYMRRGHAGAAQGFGASALVGGKNAYSRRGDINGCLSVVAEARERIVRTVIASSRRFALAAAFPVIVGEGGDRNYFRIGGGNEVKGIRAGVSGGNAIDDPREGRVADRLMQRVLGSSLGVIKPWGQACIRELFADRVGDFRLYCGVPTGFVTHADLAQYGRIRMETARDLDGFHGAPQDLGSPNSRPVLQ
jgi:hypothetical protein